MISGDAMEIYCVLTVLDTVLIKHFYIIHSSLIQCCYFSHFKMMELSWIMCLQFRWSSVAVLGFGPKSDAWVSALAPLLFSPTVGTNGPGLGTEERQELGAVWAVCSFLVFSSYMFSSYLWNLMNTTDCIVMGRRRTLRLLGTYNRLVNVLSMIFLRIAMWGHFY